MFYYPTVLKRHSGCFSTIWLVATKGIRVPRREFLKVNVISTCDDIMDYVLAQVPPPRPGLPRPRFSLYLSSQLQYGVILVYHRQCAILLEELQSVVVQLLKQKTPQKINMEEPSRLALDLPDGLSLMEEAEGAPDPLFGVMHMQETTLSPSALIQMGQEYLRGSSPEHPETSAAVAAAAGSPGSGITASPDSITLRETASVAIPRAEFEGAELDDELPDTIDFLMAEGENFLEGDLEVQREEVQEEREVERGRDARDLERERTKELTASTIESQPATLSSEDILLLPQEEPGLSVEPEPRRVQLTPVSVPLLPSPPLAARGRRIPMLQLEVLPTPEVQIRSRRKRQLVFFDPETQIPQEELQDQIENPETETRQPLFALLPRHRMPSAAELFNNPCTPLPEEVELLWRQAATVTPAPGSDLQVGERWPEPTDYEREREREMVEVAEREEERLGLSGREVPRDLAESEMLDISGLGSLPLEASDQREVSREISPLYTPERERSPVARPVSTLQDIPEVQDEITESAAPAFPGLRSVLSEHEPVLFQDLLPPEVDRRTVSNMFQRLLEQVSSRMLRVEQREPYGDILIFPGAAYEEDGELNM